MDGTYHSHAHPSLNNAHHGNPASSTGANEDNDGDGYSENQRDCNDTDVAVYPGATDIPGNGMYEDCNSVEVRHVW
ncbi:MAG: hypothetical protein GY777_23225 [Candidatus Brocadiaceae bacterium]|nr:hypothetical protein [Candidatus Brocadiaceae bacterium]